VKKSYSKAINSLNRAKELYEEHYLELRDYDKLVDATLQLAIAFFQAGYKDNGEELLKDVLVWRPTLVVDRKKYPKNFTGSLEQLKGLLENRKGGTLRVEASPADGAKVFVDGLLKGTMTGGKTGVDVKGLYRGRHYVQVIKEGHRIWAKKVGVPKTGRTTKVVAELSEAPREEVATGGGEWEGMAFKTYEYGLSGDFGMKFSRQAKKFADKAQVPYLLFGFVSKESKGTKLTLFLFKAEWSGLAEVEPVNFDQNLTNLQVNLLFLEANLTSALAKFPKNRIVRGEPDVYRKSREMREKAAEPVVVAKVEKKEPEPKVEPVRVEVKPEPKVVIEPEPKREEPVRVVKPEKKAEPVRVTSSGVEDEPVLKSRTEPEPDPEEDFGDLSGIFSGGEDNEDTGSVVGTSIPVPKEDDDPWGKDDKPDKITKKWWFWTLTGVLAVGVGVGVWGIYEGASGSSSGGDTYYGTAMWQ